MRKNKDICRLPIYLAALFISLSLTGFGQRLPSNPLIKEKHSAHKATIYSAILPGLGQAYNKKYWKVPIVYAGFGFLTYNIIANQTEYNKYKEALSWKLLQENETTSDPNIEYSNQTAANIKIGRDFYLKGTEQSYIFTALWYLINIIDASVDAHLFEFDISDNLSLKIEPTFNNHFLYMNKPTAGLKFSFSIP